MQTISLAVVGPGLIGSKHIRLVQANPSCRLVAIVAPGAQDMPQPLGTGRFHYAGVGGSGMSALAQFQAMLGGHASGSDRGFDRGERPESRAQLERLAVKVWPQDGSGVAGDCTALVVSTACGRRPPPVDARGGSLCLDA